MRSSADIRNDFLDFFRRRQHEIVSSSPVVPHDDPTLLFTNAGMNQFKDIFLGTRKPTYTRAADTQKCIRAGGKHNDLDDVGHDTYHHTFFEMLGNWSFGDYFKVEAIEWAWELLTKVWGIDPTRLHATYFEGDEEDGIEPDLEAMELWGKHLPAGRIHPGNKKDNFWEMGDTGPCGPCSEIHVDLTPDKSGAELVNAGDARVIEIWNLVFIQFNRGPDGKLTPLPAKHVDTGMGFERVVALLQGKSSNYDTDVWTPVFDAISLTTGMRAYRALMEPSDEASKEEVMIDIAYRVIADHIRCLTFALTDGAVPDREGRGYVLRRILRRAVRYGWQYMNMHEPFLYKLVPAIVDSMGPVFPELKKGPRRVIDIIREEEESFGRTLERGIALFEEAVAGAMGRALASTMDREFAMASLEQRSTGAQQWVITINGTDGPMLFPSPDGKFPQDALPKARAIATISGSDAFKLHDTYGFPIDLTQIMANERGLKVDVAEYERLMAEARERARGEKTDAAGLAAVQPDLITALGATDDSPKHSGLNVDARVIATLSFDTGDAAPSATAALIEGMSGALILDSTSFYAEQGGQVGDQGAIKQPGGAILLSSKGKVKLDPEGRAAVARGGEMQITDAQRIGDTIVHIGRVTRGRIRVGDKVQVAVGARRHQICQNHTATHLLNLALREVLGEGVQQKGSLVDHEKTRFDFSHSKALTGEEVARVEDLVNERIDGKLAVDAEPVPQGDALKINGLRAVFGEKYPDVVRVMSIGKTVKELLADPGNDDWRQYSIEFCGGTHCSNTEQIERFALVAEEAVAKGIRRVVGVTADAARAAEKVGGELVARAETLKSAAGDDLTAGISGLQQALAGATITLRHRHQLNKLIADLQKTAKKQQKEQAAGAADVVMERCRELIDQAEKVGEHAFVVAEMPDLPVEQLKQGADAIKQKLGSAVVLFGVNTGDKAMLIAAVTNDLIKKGVKAGDLVKAIAKHVDGGGGGPPTMAQAGGKSPDKLPAALDAGREWIRAKLA